MDKDYIVPGTAFRKLRAAKSLGQTVYIYGATGYGKTRLVKQYLADRRYVYFSCGEVGTELPVPAAVREGKKGRLIVVADDVHLLKNADKQGELLSLAGRPDIWLILIGRSPLPSWLMPPYVNRGFIVIPEEDLSLGEREIASYLEGQQAPATSEELAYLARKSQGNAYIIRHTALRMKEGMRPGPEMTREIQNAFADYLENYVLPQWDSDLLEFLMQISVVEEFDLPLAEMISGNSQALGMVERALEAGNFLSVKNGVYCLRSVLVGALRKRAVKVYGSVKMADYAYNAGLYYEMHDQIVPALAMFERCGRTERIRELLVRNARLNPGNGHYFELRRYYLSLKEEETEGSPVLMAGMSMLCSLLLQEEDSERWYRKLETYEMSAKGGQKREALSRLAYLDIALPHRGSTDTIQIMKRMPALLFDKGIGLPEFSVTSNIPSTMNGGKDFCHWSREDRKLAATIGMLLERVFGRYGKGLVKAALGESLYEKGGGDYEVLTLLTRARMEAESGGVPEIAFAAVGIQVRFHVFHGELQTARLLLSSFEKAVREQGACQLLPNIAALKCRLDLAGGGGKKGVEDWMKLGPDENKDFCILERYQYLTKARCYLSMGEFGKALALLEKLRYYAERYHRTYIHMEVKLLGAMAKYAVGGEWREDFLAALREACSYRFLRVISEEGAAAQRLFEAIGKGALERELPDKEWRARILEDTGKMAVRYPLYLKRQLIKTPDFCDTALAILRLQAEGKSVTCIARELSMKESTVKYHTRENYRKLGVSGKADAVLAARELGIL